METLLCKDSFVAADVETSQVFNENSVRVRNEFTCCLIGCPLIIYIFAIPPASLTIKFSPPTTMAATHTSFNITALYPDQQSDRFFSRQYKFGDGFRAVVSTIHTATTSSVIKETETTELISRMTRMLSRTKSSLSLATGEKKFKFLSFFSSGAPVQKGTAREENTPTNHRGKRAKRIRDLVAKFACNN